MSPLSDTYRQTLATISHDFQVEGITALLAKQDAMSVLYKQLTMQAQLLAYIDVFLYCAVAAGLVVPLAFFFTASKADGARSPT